MIKACIAALLALGVSAAAAQAQSRLDEIVGGGMVRVGMTGDYRPFSQRDKDSDAWSGLDVDMANNLAATIGVKLFIIQTSWADLLPDLAAGKYDVGMGGISINLARQKAAFFSAPLLRMGKTPIARCADKARFTTLADIDKPGVKVIVNPGG